MSGAHIEHFTLFLPSLIQTVLYFDFICCITYIFSLNFILHVDATISQNINLKTYFLLPGFCIVLSWKGGLVWVGLRR